jgi:predicted DNA-binding transcriptional regulator AlpA
MRRASAQQVDTMRNSRRSKQATRIPASRAKGKALLRSTAHPSKVPSANESSDPSDPQMSLLKEHRKMLEMALPSAHKQTDHVIRRAIHGLDQLLTMRDVQYVTGRDRSTIYRWIQQGLFPPKHAFRGKRRGWRRSDIERWLMGDRQNEMSVPTETPDRSIPWRN